MRLLSPFSSLVTKKREPIKKDQINVKTLKGFYLYIALVSCLMGTVFVVLLNLYFDIAGTMPGIIGSCVTSAVFLFVSSIYSLDKLDLPIDAIVKRNSSDVSKVLIVFKQLAKNQDEIYSIASHYLDKPIDQVVKGDELNGTYRITEALKKNKNYLKKFLKTKGIQDTETIISEILDHNGNIYYALDASGNGEFDRLAS